jgi:hypothetical protein
VREQDCLGAAIGTAGEQFERRRLGWGPRLRRRRGVGMRRLVLSSTVAVCQGKGPDACFHNPPIPRSTACLQTLEAAVTAIMAAVSGEQARLAA